MMHPLTAGFLGFFVVNYGLAAHGDAGGVIGIFLTIAIITIDYGLHIIEIRRLKKL